MKEAGKRNDGSVASGTHVSIVSEWRISGALCNILASYKVPIVIILDRMPEQLALLGRPWCTLKRNENGPTICTGKCSLSDCKGRNDAKRDANAGHAAAPQQNRTTAGQRHQKSFKRWKLNEPTAQRVAPRRAGRLDHNTHCPPQGER